MNEKMQPKRMEDFKNYLQQQDKSPVTIKEYARQVSLFISWYGDQDTINVQKKDILNYLSYLKHHKNHQAVSSTDRTCRQLLSALCKSGGRKILVGHTSNPL